MLEFLDKIDNLYEILNNADSGDLEAQYMAARYILYELELAKSDQDIIDRAIKYLRNAAMNGYFHGIAAQELGSLYYNGHHVAQDYIQAIIWQMAIICYQGDKNILKNPALHDYAMYLFHQSLLAGCSDPLEILGLCYYHGDAVKQSYETALFLYRFSEQPMAYGEIGVCYANGHGVEKDDLMAYQYFVKCLLFDSKRAGEIYKNLAIIYPQLDCFEKDQVFLDYCQEASVKYASDQNDTFKKNIRDDG